MPCLKCGGNAAVHNLGCPERPFHRLMVSTSAFIAGAKVDDATNIVFDCDHWLLHLRGMTEDNFRKACEKNKWAIGAAP